MMKAFSYISKSRKAIATQVSIIYQTIALQDIQAYFELFGCDLDKCLFVECIYALDNEFLKEANK